MNAGDLIWLAGDHHVHTSHSHDGVYGVARQAEAALRNGLGWLVITDHGGADHAKLEVAATHADVVHARGAFSPLLLFQGLEWNVPGSEHGTVFVRPGPREAEVLRRFEERFDGLVHFGDACTDRAHAPLACEGLRWLTRTVGAGEVADALFLINHPGRRGLVTPADLRRWNDMCPGIAVGMEGAPGHQAAGVAGQRRGLYDGEPTFGGFDPMAATVGGAWDALLAEGRRWWITANSDSHEVLGAETGDVPGRDFWPGGYSRTVVGATAATHGAVMDAIRRGRVWVGHGDLIWSLDLRAGPSGFPENGGVPLGGRLTVTPGDDVEVRMRIGLPKAPNGCGEVPRLARVDVIAGPTRPRGRQVAVEADVVASYEVTACGPEVVVRHTFRAVRASFYFRVRGTDGRRSLPGSIEPARDQGAADPWMDLWFYANPVFVDVVT